MSASGGKADVNEGLIQADARECPLFPKAAAQIRDFGELRAAAFGQKRPLRATSAADFVSYPSTKSPPPAPGISGACLYS